MFVCKWKILSLPQGFAQQTRLASNKFNDILLINFKKDHCRWCSFLFRITKVEKDRSLFHFNLATSTDFFVRPPVLWQLFHWAPIAPRISYFFYIIDLYIGYIWVHHLIYVFGREDRDGTSVSTILNYFFRSLSN